MAVSGKGYRVSSTQYDKYSVWGFDSKSYANTQFDINKQRPSELDSMHTVLVCPYIANPNIISFTIWSNSYQCLEGTTWEQWCSSAFNTGGYYVSGDNVLDSRGKYGVEVSNGNGVKANDVIIPNHVYVTG